MSWSIEEHIGENRPWPTQIVVYKGETSESMAYVSGEVADRLKDENTKLREIAKAAWGCVNRHVSCDECRMVCCGCTLQSAMRELRIEVD